MADPTIVYFGLKPTTILMQTSSGFDGTAQTGTPTLSPGLYTFPIQAGGGLYGLHIEPITVHNITFKGSGTLTIKKTIGTQEAVIGTIGSGQGEYAEDISLSPGESLKFASSGAGAVSVTGSVATGYWG